MQTKFKIVETEDYILAVSDEEIKINDLYYLPRTNNVCKCVNDPTELNLERHLGLLKIIAYLPKNNAPELDLPLLPQMVVEDNVEKLAEIYAEENAKDNNISYHNLYLPLEYAFKAGHKAATKVYSEENVYDILDLAANNKGLRKGEILDLFNKSKQSKTPKWFVAEMQTTKSEVFRENDNVPYATLKTTTKNNKTYLIGQYLNE
jgi:hypothetical protein